MSQFPLLFEQPPKAITNLLVNEVAARGEFGFKSLDGVSKPMSKLLADAVVEGFQLQGFRATTNPNSNSRYSLKGRAED